MVRSKKSLVSLVQRGSDKSFHSYLRFLQPYRSSTSSLARAVENCTVLAGSVQKSHYRKIRQPSFRFFSTMNDQHFLATCDLYDEYIDTARVPTVQWKSYGGKAAFCGPVLTIKCHEDNSRIKELVDTEGRGRIMLVDGGGSLRCALLGDNLAKKAMDNSWAGIVVYGCVRDVEVLADMTDLGVLALGCTPRKSVRRGEGQQGVEIRIGDVSCVTGDYAFCDQNGILILSQEQMKVRLEKGS